MVLKILPTHALFRALIAKGRVMSAKAREHLPVDVLAALVKANIMALHPDGAYTVHARHVESFLRGQEVNLGVRVESPHGGDGRGGSHSRRSHRRGRLGKDLAPGC